jgi:AcrR family transcriptional regulator
MTDAADPPAPPADAASPGVVPRSAWIAAAIDLLVERGAAQVKVLTLSDRLGVSRSSFYWRFKDRRALLDELLAAWEAHNTVGFLGRCAAPAETVTGAICNLFRCFVDRALFDHRLDFAVRDWARRSERARSKVERADAARLEAVAALFRRYGYAEADAGVRARVVYMMQIGYYALDVDEPLEARLANVPFYLETFTGRTPRAGEVEALCAYARARAEG